MTAHDARDHAGEAVARRLRQRDADRPLIQTFDGLSIEDAYGIQLAQIESMVQAAAR